MKLLTAAVAKSLPALYSTENASADAKRCLVKFFNPGGAGTWYAFEASPVIDGVRTEKKLTEVDLATVEDVHFFGYVTGLAHNEWGYFSLRELESVRLRFGLKIERDMHYTPESAAAIVAREG